MAPRRRAARPYHHGDLRRAAMDAALAIIGERGHLDFTLREIARRLSVSHGAPYRHFADKGALLTELAIEAQVRLGEWIQAAIDEAGGDFRARFVAAGRAYVRFALEHPALFRTLFSDEIDRQAPDYVAGKASSFGILVDYIGEAQRAGVFVGDPMTIAMSVFAMHHGLAVLADTGTFEAARPGGLWKIVDEAHGRLFDGLHAAAQSIPKATPRAKATLAKRVSPRRA